MRISGTSIGGVHLVEPEVHWDDRGEFWRSFCSDNLSAAGIDFRVVQSNVSVNRARHTVRGFHYQRPPSREQKILTVVSGAAHIVIVDVRQGSDTRLEHQEVVFEVGDRRSLVVAEGCATGFQTLTDDTIIHYQMADIYRPDSYTGFRYDDPTVGVAWPAEPAVISDRDLDLPFLDPDER